MIYFRISIAAAFKIIKSWLPEAGVRKIKVVNKQTVGDYVQEESRPVEWGGPDAWEFEWEPGRFDGVKMPPTLYKVRALGMLEILFDLPALRLHLSPGEGRGSSKKDPKGFSSKVPCSFFSKFLSKFLK